MREQLGDLHTAEAWRNRAGREVRPEELSRPAKTPRRRGAPAADPDKIKPMDELEDDQVEANAAPPMYFGKRAGVGAGGCCNNFRHQNLFPVSCCLNSSCADVCHAELFPHVDLVAARLHFLMKWSFAICAGHHMCRSLSHLTVPHCNMVAHPRMQFAVRGSALAEEEGGGDDPTVTKLYGEWQTRPWEMPAAKDGCVPKTERGNVNVPPFATRLPEGEGMCPKLMSNRWIVCIVVSNRSWCGLDGARYRWCVDRLMLGVLDLSFWTHAVSFSSTCHMLLQDFSCCCFRDGAPAAPTHGRGVP